MAGPRRAIAGCLALSALLCGAGAVLAQPRPTDGPIGGITFDPPRPSIVRHKSGNVMRGDLMAISPDQVQFRLQSGKEFLYDLKDIRSIVTNDRQFRYNSAHDTYRKAVENARGLAGVSVESTGTAAGGRPGTTPAVKTPPPPPMPVLVDSPDNYRPVRIDDSPAPAAGAPAHRPLAGADVAGQMPPIPANPPAGANAGLVNAPFYETGAFKIGFLVACFVVILLWWRNRVG